MIEAKVPSSMIGRRRVLGRSVAHQAGDALVGAERRNGGHGGRVGVTALAALPRVTGRALSRRGVGLFSVREQEAWVVVGRRTWERRDGAVAQITSRGERDVAGRTGRVRPEVRRRAVGVTGDARSRGGTSDLHELRRAGDRVTALTGNGIPAGERLAGVLQMREVEIVRRGTGRVPAHATLLAAVMASHARCRVGIHSSFGAGVDAGVAAETGREEADVLGVGKAHFIDTQGPSDGQAGKSHERGDDPARPQRGHRLRPCRYDAACGGTPGSGPTLHCNRRAPRSWLQSADGAAPLS